MSNKQVSAVSWNIHVSFRDEWTSFDDLSAHMREKFSRYEIKYCCYGEELGKQGVTPHLQGYTIFEKRYSLKKIIKDWSPCFVQASRGDSADNFEYIVKEGMKFTEFGSRPKFEKKLSKVDKMKRAIELARSDQLGQLESEMPGLWLRSRRDLERVHLEAIRPLCDKRSGIWLVGSPGTGKSLFAHRYGDVYHKPPNKWFDGYQNQEIIIIDDLDRSNAEKMGYYLKLWCDCYPFLAEVKGSALYLKHKTTIVTSNYRINTLYEDPDLRGSLHRRYKEIVVLGFRETPEGMIEIKTPDPNHSMRVIWLNFINILD
jgi:hypothetical protein